MIKATKPQLSKIHLLLVQLNILDQKADLVFEFSNYRATSSRDMSKDEATDLIKHLTKFDPLNKMRKKVFALAYVAGIIYGDTWEDKKMNAAKLNLFLRERGTVRKELSKMNKEELVKTVTQFEQIGKHKNESQASKATKSVLDELGIKIQSGSKHNTL